ncbi:hypothetical protein JOF53_007778 [Crossiella equi]|uniref:Uncharacterized protein n=1 Tax=Crossiella equi TaxID=130796 RepID=A0ABS5AQR8_9PSEU|nr:hypothetical protein [Crossiella equi]MBP2478906.1 hypothetical protein [Crossiella equi]
MHPDEINTPADLLALPSLAAQQANGDNWYWDEEDQPEPPRPLDRPQS